MVLAGYCLVLIQTAFLHNTHSGDKLDYSTENKKVTAQATCNLLQAPTLRHDRAGIPAKSRGVNSCIAALHRCFAPEWEMSNVLSLQGCWLMHGSAHWGSIAKRSAEHILLPIKWVRGDILANTLSQCLLTGRVVWLVGKNRGEGPFKVLLQTVCKFIMGRMTFYTAELLNRNTEKLQ